MKNAFNLLISLFCLFFLATESYADDLVYLDITSPETRKIMLALPDFVDQSAKKDLHRTRNLTHILAKALTFHGIIHIIPTATYTGAKGTSPNWQQSGADFAVLINYRLQKNRIQLSVVVKDITNNLVILNKKYTGSFATVENILYKLCDQIIYEFTGRSGIAQSKIAYISNRTGSKELYVSDILGIKTRQITRHHSLVVSPRFTSDGNSLSYTSYHSGNPNLYITDLRQNKITKILSRRLGLNLAPAWSPDDRRFVLTLSKSGTPDLYLMNQHGKILQRLTGHNGINVSPTWSPDGSRIAFVSDRSGKPQIYLMNMKNYQVKRLTFTGDENAEPSWSPKGNTLVFSRLINGRYQLFTKDMAHLNKMPVQITHDHNNHEAPTWSPDGKQIIFTKGSGKNKKIYAILKNGKYERMLFAKIGSQTSPRWTNIKK
jgi:TolB protein